MTSLGFFLIILLSLHHVSESSRHSKRKEKKRKVYYTERLLWSKNNLGLAIITILKIHNNQQKIQNEREHSKITICEYKLLRAMNATHTCQVLFPSLVIIIPGVPI